MTDETRAPSTPEGAPPHGPEAVPPQAPEAVPAHAPEAVPPHLSAAVPRHLAEAEPPASMRDRAAFDAEAAERQAEAALASGGEELPHHDLLGFYDRLRSRVLVPVERRRGHMP